MYKISPATVLKACNCIKKRLQYGCFPLNIPKVLGRVFFIEQLCWLLLNYFSIKKEFFEKKVSGEIAFDLISLFHVQIQESTDRSTTTREFVFLAKFAEFYSHKIFETKY